MVRSAQDNILSMISGDGVTAPGGIDARRFSISMADVRKRYTAVNVELAKRAAAFFSVILSNSTRYLVRALFIREAARAFIFFLCSLHSYSRPRCSEATDSTQFVRKSWLCAISGIYACHAAFAGSSFASVREVVNS